MKRVFLLSLLPLAAACTQLMEGGQEAERYGKEQGQATADKLNELFTYHPKPKAANGYVPPTYCYRALMDTLCYSRPLPGAEDRLIAYQGSVPENGAAAKPKTITTHEETTTVTVKELPPPALSPALARWQENAAASADLKPVFSSPPPEIKPDVNSLSATP